MSDLECPYCDGDVEPDDDVREPNVKIERECRHCGKVFFYEIEYFPSYSSTKAPCLNGGDHSYKEIFGYPVEYYKNRRRCEFCDDEIVLPEDKA